VVQVSEEPEHEVQGKVQGEQATELDGYVPSGQADWQVLL